MATRKTSNVKLVSGTGTDTSMKGFSECYYKIIEGAILDQSVLDELISQCILTIEDGEEILRQGRQSNRNKMVLDILISRPYPTFDVFIKAMESSDKNNGDIANRIKKIKGEDIEETSLLENITNYPDIAEYKVKLQINYRNIVENLSCKSSIIDNLVACDVLTIDDSEELQNIQISSSQNRRLLEKIKNENGYNEFLKALRKDDVHSKLADKIESTMVTNLKMKLLQSVMYLRVQAMEKKKLDTIPVNIQDQIQKQLDLWQKEDEKFVSTKGSANVLKYIKDESCVTVTGNPGLGKTFIARHVALVMKREGYIVIPTCIPKDIRDFTRPGSKTLFVVDDIGGHYSLNQKYLDDWKPMLSVITSLLENNDCKIIATCRLQVFKDEKFKALSIFSSNECNISSNELCLTSDEKSMLGKKYFGDQGSKISEMLDQYEFFPFSVKKINLMI